MNVLGRAAVSDKTDLGGGRYEAGHEHAAGHPIGDDIGCLTCRALLVLSTEKAIAELNWNHFWDGGGTTPVLNDKWHFREPSSMVTLKEFGGRLDIPYPQKKSGPPGSGSRNYTNAIQHIMPGIAHMELKQWAEAVAELKKAINQVEHHDAKLLPLNVDYSDAKLLPLNVDYSDDDSPESEAADYSDDDSHSERSEAADYSDDDSHSERSEAATDYSDDDSHSERSEAAAGDNHMLPVLKTYLQEKLTKAEAAAATPEAQVEHKDRQHKSCHSEIIYQQCMQLDEHQDIKRAYEKMVKMAKRTQDMVDEASDVVISKKHAEREERKKRAARSIDEATLDQPQNPHPDYQIIKRGIEILKQTRGEYYNVAHHLERLYDAHIKLLKIDVEMESIAAALNRVGRMYDLATVIFHEGVSVKKAYEPDESDEDLKVGDMVMLAPMLQELIPYIGPDGEEENISKEDLLIVVKINREDVYVNFQDPNADPDYVFVDSHEEPSIGPIKSKDLRPARMVWAGTGVFFSYEKQILNLGERMIKIITDDMNVPGYNLQEGNQGYGHYWIGDDTRALRSVSGVEPDIEEYRKRYEVLTDSKWMLSKDKNFKSVTDNILNEMKRLESTRPAAEKNIYDLSVEVQQLCCEGSGVEERLKSAKTNYKDLEAALKKNKVDVARTRSMVKEWEKRRGLLDGSFRKNKDDSRAAANLAVKTLNATIIKQAAAVTHLKNAQDEVQKEVQKKDDQKEIERVRLTDERAKQELDNARAAQEAVQEAADAARRKEEQQPEGSRPVSRSKVGRAFDRVHRGRSRSTSPTGNQDTKPPPSETTKEALEDAKKKKVEARKRVESIKTNLIAFGLDVK